MKKTKVVGGEKQSGLSTEIFKIGRQELNLGASEDQGVPSLCPGED